MRALTDLESRLTTSFALDRLWRETLGLSDGDTKEAPLRTIAELLERERVPYALIGGVAVQLHSQEPRTTLDIDLAVRTFAEIPREALIDAGFTHEGRFAHSDNWRAPGSGTRAERVAIQFSSEDIGIEQAVTGAAMVAIGPLRLRLVTVPDLLILKLAAAEEPTRRSRKRRQDLMDILTLAEEHPGAAAIIPGLEGRIGRLSQELLSMR